ncbi:MAG: Asp-tRNA(Asn)/Glu-tRNA(Gln) amidotransferase subunit GatC [Elusimicrobiota bacterium]|nr:Asp-tRNA(Asn)/Glu-tRNA(Gln) amidotransferase subunit GatC [Endomicrobiia bacterium]MDW8165600.1 Asp-tRNA(Asn)/Glu-tRNA(Gln) amidotransferase subunit GatC [Elusimicrobiota bacterium]
MQKITKEKVKHIAYLSRLALTEEEIEKYSKQLELILEYMDKLNFIDTSSVSPVSNILKLYRMNIRPYYREDIPQDSKCQKEILENSPCRVNNFFKVEKVIE